MEMETTSAAPTSLERLTLHSPSSASPSASAPAIAPAPNPYCLTSCERRGRFIPSSVAARVMLPPVSPSARAMQSRSMSRLRSLRLTPPRMAAYATSVGEPGAAPETRKT